MERSLASVAEMNQMSSLQTVSGWIEGLRLLFPIDGVLRVGAGASSGLGPFGKLDICNAVFIEADESACKALIRNIGDRPNWIVHHALVAEREGETDFFVASNPRESGVVPP